ncbi:restriction endonuclease [Horticoccus sp. 23ND18S-11]|uniref:restriction endonuclease n=1 Tax=Horticoccus sp. 23ND18S-11 TaxID=3391832 RepID=UPI0039C8CA2D
MRTLLATGLLVLVTLSASAQGLPVGSSPDSVLRTLGTPRSRSAAKEREIWMYPTFQVVFERGRMTSLTPLPTDGGTVEWEKRSGSITPISSTPVTVAPAATSRPVEKTVARPAPPARPRSSGLWAQVKLVFTGMVLMAVAIVGFKLWLWRRNRRATTGATAGATHPVTTRAGAMLAALVKTPVTTAAATPATPVAAPEPTLVPAAPVVASSDSRSPHVSKPPTLSDWELPLDLLRSLEWKRFELLVERYFTATGVRAQSNGVGADGGVDVYLYRGQAQRPFCYVQCSAWGTPRVDVKHVRDLFGVMIANRVPEGLLVTSGDFTTEAAAFARQNKITLLSGEDFIGRFNRLALLVRSRILEEITRGDYTTPTCPRCHLKLVLRANDGGQASQWVCRKFPQCHYTVKTRDALTESPLGAAP